ncbi:MAG TPA: FtsX-like permease family protein [Candidatus Hydrogenedentes bacterium]|nr:FtsX-like permease family protein [Candidatus Hydrogenedentota bacterium]HPG67047.1 FtsX-like permease family protein [Candidatus Hydrogenedentota bacterium]
MRIRSIAFLMRACMRGKELRNAGVIGGLAVGMLALGLSTVAGLGMTRSLQRHLTELFPEQRVVLRPKTVEALLLQAETMSITGEVVDAVRKLPGVVRVCPEAVVRFPLSGQGNLLGQNYSTDLSVTGVEGWLLGDEAPEDFTYDPKTDEFVPVVLSYYFLDLYNVALAESNKLPKFSPSAIIGRHITLKLNESTIHPPGPETVTKAVPSQIVALTRNPDLLGLLAPLDVVESFNEWAGLTDKVYRALHVELESAEAVEDLGPYLDDLGLEMRDRMATWRKALVVVRLVAAALVALGVLVFVLALAYLASAITWMLSERRRELALFRALGASPGQVILLLASEIGLISVTGIALGLGTALAALYFVNSAYLSWRAERAFLPETLFSLPWWWVLIMALGCWGVAMGLSLSQIIRTRRDSISTTLTKNG